MHIEFIVQSDTCPVHAAAAQSLRCATLRVVSWILFAESAVYTVFLHSLKPQHEHQRNAFKVLECTVLSKRQDSPPAA